ncbi:uncharacterized protein LOC143019498 [Oratosquilla oratoria]|uniref:uncharacterized protein LOC143019498 n=1 Tax=Oratosquilla oratoria TaxID=337810 RepID=UPI003F7756F5
MGSRVGSRGGYGLRGVLWVLAVVLVVSVLLLQSVEAKRKKDVDRDNWRISPKHRWTRKQRKASECRLGGKRYALEESWSPDLGPPFGVWYCVRCHCQKVSLH